ncbi:MAG: Nicotinamidase, partial [uncultured Phycisphaerae bacterium]
ERPHPRRPPERLRPRRRVAGAGRGRDRPGRQSIAETVRFGRRDAGLAPAGPRQLRGEPRGQARVRRDRPPRPAAGAVAGTLRAGDGGRGPRAGPRPLARRAGLSEGHRPGHRQLQRLLRQRPPQGDRPRRIPYRARRPCGLRLRPGRRLLREVHGPRRRPARLRDVPGRGRHPRREREAGRRGPRGRGDAGGGGAGRTERRTM